MTYPFAFGVRIISTLSFDLLPQVQADGPAVLFELGRTRVLPPAAGELENAYYAQGRLMEIYLGEDSLRAVIVDRLCFDLCFRTNTVRCLTLGEVSDDLVRYWFLQQILPILLLLNGSTELLHATAIRVDFGHNGEEGAVGFLGRSGIGKSTLLNYCLEQGCDLITDEHLALERSRMHEAVPSVPFYRPYRSLEDLGIRAPRFAERPVPLKRLYLLDPDTADAPVKTERLSDPETISAVLLNSQYSLFSRTAPQTRPILARRFAGLADLTRKVPVRRLRVPRSMHRLPDVYQFIQNDLLSSHKESAS
jgi:hypothetical protein